ncbi:SEC-C metal-binding domain-containing protein [Lysobacter sp. 1R34A]|uniref:SEC-C metal-binding domain-containing protein n=1 Tax=Lysobacter sp. 1R34A TaxID=3445786 RepID=UPI003EEA4C47
MVHGDKELVEKLGRNDLCPCGSVRRFKELLPARGPLRRFRTRSLLQGLIAADRGG